MRERGLSVGEVAKRSGVNVSTCHYYEQKGLISSRRNAGNQRRYHPDVLRRISVIKAAQKLGVSLTSIRQAFATLPENRTPTRADWQALSMVWKQELDQRIAAMQRLRDSLDACIGCGCLSLDVCPLYNPNDEMAKYGNGPVILDQKHK